MPERDDGGRTKKQSRIKQGRTRAPPKTKGSGGDGGTASVPQNNWTHGTAQVSACMDDMVVRMLVGAKMPGR